MNRYRAKRLLWCFMVFMAGSVANANLGRLIEVNPDYEASWGKVAFACLLAAFFAYKATDEDQLSARSVNQGVLERASVHLASDEADAAMQRLRKTIEEHGGWDAIHAEAVDVVPKDTEGERGQ